MIKSFDEYILENENNDNVVYHYFYKITNIKNGHFYYGVHSTDNIDDNYMGSGTRLKLAKEKYGIENFKKEILKYFKTRKECEEYEKKIVNHILVSDSNCYNCVGGGGTLNTIECATVTDGKRNFVVSVHDLRYLSGELKGATIGRAHYIDNDGNCVCLTPEEAKERGLNGITKGKVPVRNKGTKGRYHLIDVKDFDPNIYETPSSNKVTVKDENGNIFRVSKYDERYLSGELKYIWTGRHHTEDSIKKMKDTHIENGHQQNEKNSQFGTVWMINTNTDSEQKFRCDGEKEMIELFEKGWIPGRISGTPAKWYIKYKETGELPNRIIGNHVKLTDSQRLYNEWKMKKINLHK